MHTGTAEIACRVCAVLSDAEHEDQPARLIFAEERTGLAADHHDRIVLLIGLHMDAAAVAAVPLDEDASAAHAIAAGVADVAVDDDITLVHRVADRLLRVAEYLDGRAVEILAEAVARRAVDDDSFAGRAAAEITLADRVFDRDIVVVDAADLFVYLLVIGQSCLYSGHQCAPPNFFARSARENAISCGFSRIRSKSMLSSGVCSRMSEV